jgi:hypothetical protein
MNVPLSRRRFLRVSAAATALGAVGLDLSGNEAAAASVISGAGASASTSNLTVSNLRVDYLTDPLGIDDTAPFLSWLLSSAQQSQVQAAYQVQAASSTALLAAGTPDLWDSGRVTSGASFNVPYAGTALTSRKQVHWQVRAWDGNGNPSAWSPAAGWEMGLLTAADWYASWISNPGTGALPLFAKQFTLAKSVSSARLYITGVGIYEASVNGTAVGAALLQPQETDYLKRVVYTTYDVTDLLNDGANTLGVELGNGIANITSNSRYNKFTGTMVTPRLLAQLEVTYTDGTTARVVSDSSWLTTSGPTTFSDWYGGEDYDARLAVTGWQAPGANLSSWRAVTLTAAPSSSAVLSAQMMPEVQQVGTLTTVAITQPVPGTYVFDLGTNFAGWPQLQVSGPAGTTVTMYPGELLAANGTVSQVTTGSPIYDTYILAGQGTEVWHPHFMYHGFRYLQVTGLPSAPASGTVTGLALSTVNTVAGTFTSSSALLNTIYQIVNQAIANNMYSVLTDCPHREKLGWLEEAHLVFQSISRRYDVAAYYRQLLRNTEDSQTSSGLVPSISPEYVVFSGGYRDDPNWGSTTIIAAWQLYQTYGDTRTLSTHYPTMQKYLAYLGTQASGNLLNYGLGDWAALDASTPAGVTATFGYYESAQVMSSIAAVLGKTGDAATYSALAQAIASAFNAKYLASAHNTYSTGSQADDALALDMGIVPVLYYQAVLEHLVAGIQAYGTNGYHLSVGEIGLPSLFRALSQGGHDDILYAAVTSTTYPSYGYLAATGATSLTEYWDGAAGTGSQDHFMLGAVAGWLSTDLGGIQADPAGVAYDKVIIRPSVVGSLTSVTATYTTMYGTISSEWSLAGSALALEAQIPVGTNATIMLPASLSQPAVTSGQGFQLCRNGYAIYAVGSGTYQFTSTLGGGNLALGRTVTSSNSLEQGSWGAAKLTDGITVSGPSSEGYSSNVLSSANVASSPVWVDINLGSAQTVSQVKLFPRTDAASTSGGTPNFPVNFTIQIAPSSGAYTTVATITGQPDPGFLPQTYSFTPAAGQHVRIVVTELGTPAAGEGGSGYYRLQLAEAQVFNASDLALKAAASSNNSLESGAWGVHFLTDGVTTSTPASEGYSSNILSSPDVSSSPLWVDIDLGSSQQFSQVVLYPRTDAASTAGNTPNFPVNFTLQVAQQGGTYSTVATVANQPNPLGSPQTYSFTATAARHVRVVVATLGIPAVGESGSGYYRLQLAEVEVLP